MSAGEEEVFGRTTANRLHIADVLDGLSAEQWHAPTLCVGWSVHVLAAHLLQPFLVGFGRFFLASLRFRGHTDAVVDHLARRLARHDPATVVALLRAHAPDRVRPPRVGPMGPFAETCLHLRDVARPLGLAADVPTEDWVRLLDYFASGRVAPALVARGRLDGLRLVAADAPWSAGAGLEVRGPVEALAMAAAGRAAALPDLTGPGVDPLRALLGATRAR